MDQAEKDRVRVGRKEMTLWKIGNMYTNRRKWINLRKTEPCLSQLDPFPSIRVHISYLPQCHFFPTRTLSFSAWSISFYSCTYFLSSTVSFLSYTNIEGNGSSWERQGSCRKEMTLWKIGKMYTNRRKFSHSVISFLSTRTLPFPAWSISFY
jgi:hypothetical protein